VADEPIAALDASAQAQIANLLVGLSRERGVSLLFISHDLAIVRQVADAIAVMYLGRVVENGPTGRLWSAPAHPYTEALVGAVPRPDGLHRLPTELPGDVPDPAAPPPGCRFHPRCRPSLTGAAPKIPHRSAGMVTTCAAGCTARASRYDSPRLPIPVRVNDKVVTSGLARSPSTTSAT
jgi:oligopeptide/dipeptide ABC transporter ATP-binding protein